MSKISSEIYKYKNEFYKLYNSSILPVFISMEKKRKKLQTRAFLIAALMFIIGSALCVFAMVNLKNVANPNDLEIFYILAALCYIAMILYPAMVNSDFIKEIKSKCMPSILNIFGNITWMCRNSLITNSDIRISNLFAEYNTRTDDDGFSGTYNGIKFDISETHLEHITGSGKNRRCINIFKGVIIKFKFNKNIGANTLITPKYNSLMMNKQPFNYCNYLYIASGIFFISAIINRENMLMPLFVIFTIFFAVMAFVGQKLSKNQFNDNYSPAKFEEIKLEDPEFNKKYKAYSTDQIEGRYLITPAFMERFKNLHKAFGTNTASCSFYDDTLMFAMPTNKNLFELGNLFKTLENVNNMENFFNEISAVYIISDYFKLNENSGL